MSGRAATNTQVVVRMPTDLRAQLEQNAARNERTLAQEIRMACRRHLATEPVHDRLGDTE